MFFNPAPSPAYCSYFPPSWSCCSPCFFRGWLFSYNSGIFALAGMLLAVVWLGMLVLIALPQTDTLLAGATKVAAAPRQGPHGLPAVGGVIEFGRTVVSEYGPSQSGILGSATP